MINRRKLALILAIAAVPESAVADSIGTSFTVPANIQIETGDTWSHDGRKYRLYGVQSCLRGTNFITPTETADCGLVSLAQFAALVQTAPVSCQPVGLAKDGSEFAVCGARLGKRSGETKIVDLGTALIASGYAFAAIDQTGTAVNANYLIAELVAKNKRRGLWAGEFRHPVQMMVNGDQP
jgi:endonuclease YncB( thermonuclease family)